MIAPFVILASGIGTFVVLAAAGLSVIDRYLLMPAVMILIFCAFALTRLDDAQARAAAPGLGARRGRRSPWSAIYQVASTLSVNKIATELGFRDDSHTSLVAILDNPKVRAGLRCGPVSVPDHKLRPDVMFLLDRPASGVIDRNEARHEADRPPRLRRCTHAEQHGVALYPLGLAVSRLALVSTADNPLDQDPTALPGFRWIVTTQYYAAYERC